MDERLTAEDLATQLLQAAYLLPGKNSDSLQVVLQTLADRIRLVARGEATLAEFCERYGLPMCDCYMCMMARRAHRTQMIVCPKCGNKRCPKASDHTLECTGSNEPGQPGSVY